MINVILNLCICVIHHKIFLWVLFGSNGQHLILYSIFHNKNQSILKVEVRKKSTLYAVEISGLKARKVGENNAMIPDPRSRIMDVKASEDKLQMVRRTYNSPVRFLSEEEKYCGR